jgi:hypothetical protein
MARFVQDPVTLRLVPAEEYSPESGHFHIVMPDISPYQSMIDGSQITSRSHHRKHLREHGCIEIGNEKVKPPKRDIPDFKADIVRAMYETGVKRA